MCMFQTLLPGNHLVTQGNHKCLMEKVSIKHSNSPKVSSFGFCVPQDLTLPLHTCGGVCSYHSTVVCDYFQNAHVQYNQFVSLVYVCIHTYVCTYVYCVYMCVFTYVHTYILIHTLMYMCVYTCIRTYLSYVRTYVRIKIYIHMYTHVRMYSPIYLYTH